MLNKAKKPPQSTTLFWIGLLLTILGAILQLVNPTASLVAFIIIVVGAVVSGWQKIAGDEERARELEQERERNKAIAQNEDRHAREREMEENLSKAPDALPPASE
jgi:membrane protein implicated in regulation of membrane protease activity